jgi:hypothetical protein
MRSGWRLRRAEGGSWIKVLSCKWVQGRGRPDGRRRPHPASPTALRARERSRAVGVCRPPWHSFGGCGGSGAERSGFNLLASSVPAGFGQSRTGLRPAAPRRAGGASLSDRSRQAPIGHEIEAFLSPWEEDWRLSGKGKPWHLPREAAGGGPVAERSEERLVEGASLRLGGTIGQLQAQWMGLAPSTNRSTAGLRRPRRSVPLPPLRGGGERFVFQPRAGRETAVCSGLEKWLLTHGSGSENQALA